MRTINDTPVVSGPEIQAQTLSAEGLDATRQVLDLILSADDTEWIGPGKFGVRLWDGSYWPQAGTYKTALVLNNPYIFRKILLAGNELTMAEAYIYKELDIEGDLEGVFPLALTLRSFSQGPLGGLFKKARLLRAILRLPAEKSSHPAGVQTTPAWNGSADSGGDNAAEIVKEAVAEKYDNLAPKPAGLSRYLPAMLKGRQHSVRRDKQAIAYHYNLSNDFYSLWLDPTMTYSCAYFEEATYTLAQAQQAKLDYICRKLRLKPGMRVLDIGCGWGGLAIYAAKNYGVTVLGITLSHEQAELANRRVVEAGLQGKVQIKELDYRELKEHESFDALVSVGMFEHVGEAMLPTYFQKAYDLLKPGGVFLNHGIARGNFQEKTKGPTFINTYVFPDGELVPISQSLKASEEAGLEVRDVESLREHYQLTLRHWSINLLDHSDQALDYVGEATYRVWRLYLAASAFGFGYNWLNLYQALLVKPEKNGDSHLPLTRADWYDSRVKA